MDGQCIPSSLVCDGKVDCSLRTDELFCSDKKSNSDAKIIQSRSAAFDEVTSEKPYKLVFNPQNPTDSHQVSLKIQENEVSLIKFELEVNSCLRINGFEDICNESGETMFSTSWIVGEKPGESVTLQLVGPGYVEVRSTDCFTVIDAVATNIDYSDTKGMKVCVWRIMLQESVVAYDVEFEASYWDGCNG